jgi:hypothetical protein
MFCRNCGSEVKDNTKFCSKCGSNVERINIDANQINRQNETSNNTSPQQPSQAPPQQPPRQYISPQQPQNQPPAGGGDSKRPGGRNALIIILIIALVAGLGANIFQFINGTHILSGSNSSLHNTGGLATYKDVNPDSIIKTEKWGYVPANQVIIVFYDDVDKTAAKKVIGQIEGTIVGELEFINLYQIETADKTESELNATLDAASGMDGVELVFTNVPAYGSDTAGTPCSPLKDPAYTDPANSHYNIIGMENAWKILKGSGVPLNKVNVGVLDEAFYTGSDEFGGKVKLSGDTTDNPVKKNNQIVNAGFTHGTKVAHVIGADAENSGMVGVAGVLEENLNINVKNVFDANPYYTATQADAEDLTQFTDPANGVAYTDKTLVYLKKMVDDGATVINCSFNFKPPSDNYEHIVKAYEKFFKKMQETKPNVIFVASAGNSGNADKSQGALNGKNDCPAGIKLPNVITVGAVNNDGSRADFSSFATGDAEVTLSAPGVQMVVGTDENGQPIKANGTSFSAPQVTSAIALIQSINPDLNAEQVKELLVKTSAPGITTGDQSIPIPEGMGAGVLRVDQAVLQTINDMREKENLPPYEMQQLLDINTVTLTAKGSGLDYTLSAHIPAALAGSADVKIEVTGQHSLKGDTAQSVPVGSDGTWEITLDKDEVFVRVKRLDNGACAYMTLKPGAAVAGLYNASGSATVWGSTDPIKDFTAKVEQNGTAMKIIFDNDSDTILTGTYDEATATFVGRDTREAEDIWSVVWWQMGDTTIVFDPSADPIKATGTLYLPEFGSIGDTAIGDATITFTMVKASDS